MKKTQLLLPAFIAVLSASCSPTPTGGVPSSLSMASAKPNDLTIQECFIRHSFHVEDIRKAASREALSECSSRAHAERQRMLYEMSYLSSKKRITQAQAQEWHEALKASAQCEETAYREALDRISEASETR